MDIRNLTISSTNPCLLVYLIDQSGSMDGKFGNASHAKAIEVANAINETIYEVGLRCIEGSEQVKNRFEIAVIGYGKDEDHVQSAGEGQLKNKWVVSINTIFVINITDGEATDGGRNFSDLIGEVNRLKALRTNYGNVNVFNIHISDKGGDRILFPSSIFSNDSNQNLLFDLSSNLDENMVRIANQKNYNINLGAKGYVFNGNAYDLINFLNIGTPQ